MALPISVTYTFATATSAIPLSQLDANFTTCVNGINGIGNGTNALSNVSITGGNVAVTTATATTINATTLNAATHRSDTTLTFQSNVSTTAMTINTSQNVGIGTTTIPYKLVVSGTTNTGIAAFSGNNNGSLPGTDGDASLCIGANYSGGSGEVDYFHNNSIFVGTNGGHRFIQRTGASTAADLLWVQQDLSRFYTGGSERMRIDSSGNVGIGTTSPRNPASLARVLSIDGGNSGVCVSAGSDANTTVLRQVNADGYLLTYGSGNLILGQANTERARIDTSGNLLVGTTSAAGRLTVKAPASGTTAAMTVSNSGGTTLFTVREDGLFGTGAAANSPYNLTTANAANMNVDASGNVTRSTSSRKYKTDVVDATHGLTEVMQLRSVTYKGKNNGETIFGGLIAEEVHAAGLTEFVQYAEDGSPDALAYGNMVSLCIKAIQEQQATITALTARVAALEAK